MESGVKAELFYTGCRGWRRGEIRGEVLLDCDALASGHHRDEPGKGHRYIDQRDIDTSPLPENMIGFGPVHQALRIQPVRNGR